MLGDEIFFPSSSFNVEFQINSRNTYVYFCFCLSHSWFHFVTVIFLKPESSAKHFCCHWGLWAAFIHAQLVIFKLLPSPLCTMSLNNFWRCILIFIYRTRAIINRGLYIFYPKLGPDSRVVRARVWVWCSLPLVPCPNPFTVYVKMSLSPSTTELWINRVSQF